MKSKFIFSCLLLVLISPMYGQQNQLSQITNEEEIKAIEAIALYSENDRMTILEAAKYPEILVRMQAMQSKTELSFQELLFPLTRADQERFYDLARYPDLIKQLTTQSVKPTEKETSEILKSSPDEIQETAKELVNKQYSTLNAIGKLFNTYENDFNQMLSQYPPKTQDAYQALVKQPEIVEILTDNMNMTVLLGDIYRRNPSDLIKELEALNADVSKRKEEELEQWQNSLKENPEALAEYEQAAKDYAKAEGYDESEYTAPVEQYYTTQVYVQYAWQPYPYWFGRPWWNVHNYWYSYPWWYHWGFYYGPGNGIVFMGLPSYGFVNWQFYNPYCFYYYPHYTNVVIAHCHRSTTGSSLNTVVRQWENDVKGELPENWLADDEKRPDRLREYGKFELDYADAVENKLGNTPSKAEYLNNNRENYPTIEPVLAEQPSRLNTNKAPISETSPASRNIPPSIKPNAIDPQKSESRPIDRATDYHQNTWSRPKSPSPSQQNRTPSTPTPSRQSPVQKAPSSPKQPSSSPQRSPKPSQSKSPAAAPSQRQQAPSSPKR